MTEKGPYDDLHDLAETLSDEFGIGAREWQEAMIDGDHAVVTYTENGRCAVLARTGGPAMAMWMEWAQPSNILGLTDDYRQECERREQAETELQDISADMVGYSSRGYHISQIPGFASTGASAREQVESLADYAREQTEARREAEDKNDDLRTAARAAYHALMSAIDQMEQDPENADSDLFSVALHTVASLDR